MNRELIAKRVAYRLQHGAGALASRDKIVQTFTAWIQNGAHRADLPMIYYVMDIASGWDHDEDGSCENSEHVEFYGIFMTHLLKNFEEPNEWVPS